jgi:hypothetical protein
MDAFHMGHRIPLRISKKIRTSQAQVLRSNLTGTTGTS